MKKINLNRKTGTPVHFQTQNNKLVDYAALPEEIGNVGDILIINGREFEILAIIEERPCKADFGEGVLWQRAECKLLPLVEAPKTLSINLNP